MKHHLLRILFLISGLASGGALTYIIQSIPPSYSFMVKPISLSILILFFILVFIFIFSFVTFVFRKKIHGLLSASAVTIYLILRLLGFTNIIYLILLLALFIALEFACGEQRP